MRVVVTGGLGFIGSAVIRQLVTDTDHEILNLDHEGYAATHESVEAVAASDQYCFASADIRDASAVNRILDDFNPDAIMHLAAETHVDRSIDGPTAFVETNVLGTLNLLQAARRVEVSRFHHISTDEVYGSLGPTDPPFTEASPYDPHSPYSATKAAADHLVRSWGDTYGLPVVLTNTSNNYGPFQFPEKLIPLMTLRSLNGASLPVYGSGTNVRDWIHVDDHARALIAVLERGAIGTTYCIGAAAERTNIAVVEAVCDAVDRVAGPLPGGEPRRRLVTFVDDRPGHDQRYAIDATRIRTELGWAPTLSFEDGLAATVEWYIEHADWWAEVAGPDSTRRQGHRT